MAQRTIVELIDDLDGTSNEDIETVSFGLDGATYEIDLNDKNAAKLREALDDFVSSGRRIGGRVRRGTTPSTPAGTARTKEQTQAIRQWAKKNGHDVSDRGRIPSTVIEAFEAAHKAAKRA